jgi:predicted HicB family RNase H-like nuclease
MKKITRYPVLIGLRMPLELHRDVERAARAEYDSVQSWIRRTLANAVHELEQRVGAEK